MRSDEALEAAIALAASGAILYALAIATRLVGRAVRDAWRRRQRRREVQRALEKSFGLPDRALRGTRDVAIPDDVGRDVAVRSQGGYRGARAPTARDVVEGATRWTSLSLPVRVAVQSIRVRRRGDHGSDPQVVCTGDSHFDEVFFVHVDPGASHESILNDTMRRALLELPRSSLSPRLTLRDGALHVEWLGDPDPVLVEVAIGGLKSVRGAV